jgi:hypothetical protein
MPAAYGGRQAESHNASDLLPLEQFFAENHR